MSAHRWSYTYFRGPIPQGMYVCHTCDVPLCVNPNHLFIGSPKDNMIDCSVKGRTRRGETATNVKLSESDVIEIKRLISSGASGVEVAEAFGIKTSQVSRIKNGHRWGHLNKESK